MGRACRKHGDKEECVILVSKRERNRLLGNPRHRWNNNIKFDLRERGCDGMDWIELPQNGDKWLALVNTEMNFRFP
jgi:hypothetical protein